MLLGHALNEYAGRSYVEIPNQVIHLSWINHRNYYRRDTVSLGLTQYSSIIEKSRLAEAKVRIGVMRDLTFQYYLENGSLDGLANEHVDSNDTCVSTSFYRYRVGGTTTGANLIANRCTSGGKLPNAYREHNYYFVYYPATEILANWHCIYTDDGSSYFGLPP